MSIAGEVYKACVHLVNSQMLGTNNLANAHLVSVPFLHVVVVHLRPLRRDGPVRAKTNLWQPQRTVAERGLIVVSHEAGNHR